MKGHPLPEKREYRSPFDTAYDELRRQDEMQARTDALDSAVRAVGSMLPLMDKVPSPEMIASWTVMTAERFAAYILNGTRQPAVNSDAEPPV